MSHALPTFTPEEVHRVQRLLAVQVARMMGRKLEEEDWASVYCAAKDIPNQGWSNLNVDVMHGALGIEQKMLCYRSKPTLLAACGTTLMHPSATRSLRVNDINGDPDDEMRSIFRQYRDLLHARRETVAAKGEVDPEHVDLRTGWLLWQASLREFLYFEERTIAPDPGDYYAEWIDRADGRRKGSRNLWIYHRETGVKRYSLTTSAGVKLQPYFDVPGAKDPNLYHWTVIGETIDSGDVRIWLTIRTAMALRNQAGSLEKDRVSSFILEAVSRFVEEPEPSGPADNVDAVVEVLLSSEAYEAMDRVFPSTNDDHLVQQVIDREAGPYSSSD